MARFARMLPIVLVALLFSGLFLLPASAGKTEVPVSWTVTGSEIAPGRVWTSVENGVVIRHTRSIELFVTVFGDFESLTTVVMDSDIAVATGVGTHRGNLMLETADGTLTGQFRGTTTGAVLAGTYKANQGTGSFEKKQIKASYSGTSSAFLELAFAGYLS